MAGGLVATTAWVRQEAPQVKRRARNARHRDKQAALGIVQVSLQVPAGMADTFRELARSARESGTLEWAEQKADISALTARCQALERSLDDLAELAEFREAIETLSWWRRILLRLALVGL